MIQNRKIDQKQGTVDSNGNIVITFDPAPQGSILTGSVTIMGSPSGAIWTINASGLPIDTIAGSGTAGNIQLVPNELLTITASNLPVGTKINASYVAKLEDENSAEIVTPGHDGQQIQAGYARPIGNGTTGAGGSTVNVNLQPTDRSIVYLATATGTAAIPTQAIGNITGIDYLKLLAVKNVYTVGANGEVVLTIPAFGAVDTQIAVGIQPFVSFNILATPDEILGGTGAEPLITLPVLPTTTANQVTVGSGASNVVLLAAPATGFVWQISALGIYTAAAYTAAGNVVINGATTGKVYWAVSGPTGAAPFGAVPGPINIAEGLNGAATAVGVNSVAYATAVQVVSHSSA